MRSVSAAIVVVCLFLGIFSKGFAADREALHLRSIQADFIQEKHLKILARPIVSTGTFAFQAPQSLRWEYVKDIPSVLLMYDGKVKKYVQRDGKFIEDKSMGFGSMQVVLGQISEWLDGRFRDNDMFTVTFADERSVQLTPRDSAMAGLISRIELQFAEQKGLLDSVTIYEGPDSYTRMTFQNRVLNTTLPSSLFIIK